MMSINGMLAYINYLAFRYFHDDVKINECCESALNRVLFFMYKNADLCTFSFKNDITLNALIWHCKSGKKPI